MNKNKPWLNKLERFSIFTIIKADCDEFKITEACDNYFALRLTKSELIALADELRDLANEKDL